MTNLFWKSWRKHLSVGRSGKPCRRSRRLELERLEDRTVPSITLLNHYQGMNSTTGSGFEPPDTQGAAGPSSVVETVNQAIRIYNPKSSGTPAQTDTLPDFFFTKGGLSHVSGSDAQADSFVTYDSLAQRFIAGDLEFDASSTSNGAANALLLAVSKSSNPTTLTSSSWFFYEIATTQSAVNFQDYPGNVGYNADALVITVSGFDSGGAYTGQNLVNAISMKALTSGTPLTLNTNYFQTNITSDYAARPTTMEDSTPGGPMWILDAPENPSGAVSTISVLKMTNVLSANPTYTTTTLAVNPYYNTPFPLDPSGKHVDDLPFDSIIQADERNGTIVATHEIGDAAGDAILSRWYAINVSRGAPALEQQGDIGGGPGTFYDYPGIGINAQGDIGMTYILSGTAPGMFESTYITGRTPADALGTMETPVLVQAGTANYNFSGFKQARQGDMSSISVDPNGTFWAFNEWVDGSLGSPNWGTAIGNFSVGSPLSIILTGATEGVPLNNVPVATFIDLSGTGLGSYSAVISWGDGLVTNGIIKPTGTPGLFVIIGSHTYLNAGNYTLTVSVSNGSNTLGPVSGNVAVADAPLHGFAEAINTAVSDFVTNSLVGVFTDTDPTLRPPSQYTATVIWDEGEGLTFTSTGSIVRLSGNTFAVYSSSPFSFPAGGLFTIKVVVTDQIGGGSVTINSSLGVADNTAIPPLIPIDQEDTGPFNKQFVTLEDALTNLLKAEQLFMAAFSVGTTAQKERALGNLVNALFAYELAVLHYDHTLPGA